MKRKALRKAAISSLMVATTMVGCAGAAFQPRAAAPARQDGRDVSTAVERALADRKVEEAVQAAEAAVLAEPLNAAYRLLLGRAYIANGRFASAQTALSDAMTLGNRDARTIVSLALVKAALGNDGEARELLAANAGNVPAGDYGLAMAMAGDAGEGVRILSQAIHDPSATARTRQNLAYAYALSGRWKDARMLVGMDLDPLAANQRIVEWAQTSAQGFEQQRVAAFMGVNIDAADRGQPTALALAPEAARVQMAEASASVEYSLEAPAPSTGTAPAVEAPAPQVALAYVSASSASVPTAPVKVAPLRPAPRVAMAPRPQQAAFLPVTASSKWVVQLGAYDSAAIAQEKWFSLARRYGMLAARPVLTSQIALNGDVYHRLAVSGFASRGDAMSLCRHIKARQGQCFVRANVPDAAAPHWAMSARGRQFASR